jgi:hypothetical protein
MVMPEAANNYPMVIISHDTKETNHLEIRAGRTEFDGSPVHLVQLVRASSNRGIERMVVIIISAKIVQSSARRQPAFAPPAARRVSRISSRRAI